MTMWRELQPGDPGVIGPYRLRGLVGVGGMGRVYQGVSAGGRLVAVKVIRADLAADGEFRTRFQREIAVARKVSGQFTAPVIDADLDGPVPWLATAYVAGPSLADAVAEHGPLPVGSVLELAAGLAEGLSAIHAAGVVHRDLKPANVLLAEDGPRVIDFGISLGAEASALTRTGLVVGSPGFMSPEQAEGREVGPPSDIFSLGAVLAFAATGKGPFGAGSTPALVYRVVHSPAGLDHVPAELRPLIGRCLAKDPGQRPTARDLLAEAGPVWPAAGWLPEPVTRTFVQLPTQLDGARTVTSLSPGTAPQPARTQRSESRPRRRGLGRPLVLASMVAGLLAASVGGGIALTGSAPSSYYAAHPGHTARAHMTTHNTTETRRSVKPAMSPSPTTTPAPAVVPMATVTPTAAPTATASATVTPPATATTTPAATPTATTTPAATPTATTTPAATPTAITTPTATQSASTAPVPGTTATAPPA
jgi:eukaryotic-like serine/threonine-protein kinase